MENVPEIRSKQNLPHFTKWIQFLESLGYSNHVQILNAKDYGIPQSRERCFMVSILEEYRYVFPKERKLELRLRDILDTHVADKYYIKDAKLNKILTTTFNAYRTSLQFGKDVCDTLLARDDKDPKCIVIGKLSGGVWDRAIDRRKNVYSGDALSSTLEAVAGMGGNTEVKVLENSTDKCIIAGHLDNAKQLEMHNRVYSDSGLAPTLTCQGGGNIEKKVQELSGQVRKLTQHEYWRLMGFEDKDFAKVAHKPKTTLYSQAGNSIVGSVLVGIFGRLYGIDTSDIEYSKVWVGSGYEWQYTDSRARQANKRKELMITLAQSECGVCQLIELFARPNVEV